MIKYFLIFIGISMLLFSAEEDTISIFAEEDTIPTLDKLRQELSVESKSKIESLDEEIKPINKKISKPDDIKIFTSKKVEPINYTNTISLNKLQVSEKKQKFFHMILPAILMSKEKFRLQREKVKEIIAKESPSIEELDFLEKMYKTFRTEDNKELLNRMRTHPVSIVLAQAAIESAWGESRFFKEGKNIFGMWSYNKNEPRIRAKGTRNGKPIYVKKYKTISDAIDDYFITIGRGSYKSFRKHRRITDDPLKLVDYLVNYCELKKTYTKRLKKFIISNKLKKFDEFRLDTNYFSLK